MRLMMTKGFATAISDVLDRVTIGRDMIAKGGRRNLARIKQTVRKSRTP